MLHPIARLCRLWILYATMDLMWLTRDLRYFFSWYVADVVLSVAAVTSSLFLAERFNGIGDWSKFEVLFLLGYVTTVKGVAESLFGYNILHISRRLGRGQFDHTLIQPQPVWMSLLTEGFSPFSGSALLFPGIALMVWSLTSLEVVVSPGWSALLLLNLGASSMVVVAFSYIWGSLAFWAPRAAEELSSPAVEMTKQLSIFPLDGVGPWLLGTLNTVLPVGLVGWIPTRNLLGLNSQLDTGLWGWMVTPAASCALVFVAILFFQKGMVRYGRTGSQRYSTFGHRR